MGAAETDRPAQDARSNPVPGVSKGLAPILLQLNLVFNFLHTVDLLLPSAMQEICSNSAEANVITQHLGLWVHGNRSHLLQDMAM